MPHINSANLQILWTNLGVCVILIQIYFGEYNFKCTVIVKITR